MFTLKNIEIGKNYFLQNVSKCGNILHYLQL